MEITDILQKTLTLEATSLEEALRMAKFLYDNEKVILTSSNLVEVNFEEVGQK